MQTNIVTIVYSYCRVFAQNPKSNFIALKSSFPEPPSTENISTETVYALEIYVETACILKMYKKIILRARGLTIYVICALFANMRECDSITLAGVEHSKK